MTCVLVVDDEPAMGRLLEFALSDLGVRVVQEARVADAVVAIHAHSPRVVLLDLALEDEDGLDLLSKLRVDERTADLPVLVFTVHDSRELEARALGAKGLVRKPFRAKELRETLDPYLR